MWFPLARTHLYDGVGLIGVERTGDKANLNYACSVLNTPRVNKVFNFNCFYCHAETVGGKAYLGLGNTTRDFTGDVRNVCDTVRAGANLFGTPGEKEEASILQHRFAIASDYMKSSTVGANPSMTYVYALMAHRDPATLKWTDNRLLEMPTAPPLPVAVPPWWQMRKRKTLFANGELPLHWSFMTLATLMGQESPEQYAQSAEGFKKVKAFVETLPPPEYPQAVNASLAGQGKAVFETTCSTCHGTYGSGGTYPERVIPFSEIGTDRALGDQQTKLDERFVG